MRTKTVRILNIVAGILLIAAGIYCLCNEDVAVLSAGLMLGIFMLAAGITEIVVFAGMSGVLIGSSWLLLDGVLTVIMSLFLLFNQWFTLLSLPFLFTVWLMFSGLSRFVSAFDLHAPGVASGAGGRAKAINKINAPPSLNRTVGSKKTVFFYCFKSFFPAAQMPARISATDRPMRIPERKSCTSVPPVVLDKALLAMPRTMRTKPQRTPF